MPKGDAMIFSYDLLIADEERVVSDLLKEQFDFLGDFTPFSAGSGREVLEFIKKRHVDFLILGGRLPDMDSNTLYQALRQMEVSVPIIFLLTNDTEGQLCQKFTDPFVTVILKPFKLKSLLKVLRSNLHKHQSGVQGDLAIGDYIFRPLDKIIIAKEGTAKINLTDKETLILKYLYYSQPKTVSRNMLLEQVWGYNTGITTHTLETHIYRLRRKIEKNPSEAKVLQTEKGGYRLSI